MRMLRPSRPMIRPFISSPGSSTRRVVVSPACGRPAAASRPRGCCGPAARPRAWSPPRSRRAAAPAWWRASCLDVGHQDLLRLRGAQARDALELAALDPLGLLQLLALLSRGCARGPRVPARAARRRRAAPRATRSRAARPPPSGRSPRGAPGARPRAVDGLLRRRRLEAAGRRRALAAAQSGSSRVGRADSAAATVTKASVIPCHLSPGADAGLSSVYAGDLGRSRGRRRR